MSEIEAAQREAWNAARKRMGNDEGEYYYDFEDWKEANK